MAVSVVPYRYHRGGGSWLPNSLSGLQLWLDGSDKTTLFQDSAKTTPVTADGDVVGAWADKSGNGNDVLQATTANKPLYKTGIKNGLSALLLDGTNDWLQGAFTQLSQPYNVIAVAQLDATVVNNNTSTHIIDGNDAVNRAILFQRSTPTPDSWAFNAGTSIDNGNSDSNWNLWYVLFNGASSDLRINGASVAAGDAGAQNLDGITIGSKNDGTSNYWKGYINELLIYDPSLSTANRTLLEAYINSKWSIY